jgi:hypothetical protein
MVRAAPVHFTAPDGSFWAVHEIRDDELGLGYSLIFVSDEGFRRVRSYPPSWRELDSAALWALSWTR